MSLVIGDIRDFFETQNLLSIRSLNICLDNEILTVEDLKNHLEKYGTFKNLRRCGDKSNKELKDLCALYLSISEISENKNENINRPETLTQQINITELFLDFGEDKKAILYSFIEDLSKRLTVRSLNGLSNYLGGEISAQNVINFLLDNSKFNPKSIRNIGDKSVTEIEHYLNQIKEIVFLIASKDESSEIRKMTLKSLFKKNFNFQDLPPYILNSENIFTWADFIIETDLLYDKKRSFIFKESFKIYSDFKAKTTESIAKVLCLTRERVRQLEFKCFNDLEIKLSFIRNLKKSQLEEFGIDEDIEYLIVDDNLLYEINSKSQTRFSKEFITLLIHIFRNGEFEIVGDIENVLRPKKNGSFYKHNWKNLYLVNKEIYKYFDFNSFANDVSSRLLESINDTYTFNFKGYITNFLKIHDRGVIANISPFAEKIINQEFDLFLDQDENIVFERNTTKQVYEYAIEALIKLNVPSKIDEIYYLIDKDYPGITKSKEALRSSLNRQWEFIYFGRSSTYGLRKWEIEKEGIKGGTIKSLLISYLNEKEDPIHIIELLNLIHKYRERTNAKNVLTNLKLDSQRQFIIFNQNFVGLSEKIYKSNLTALPKFLGKTITSYIAHHNRINRLKVEQYFAQQLEISEENFNNILQLLIENDFIQIDNQNNLYI